MYEVPEEVQNKITTKATIDINKSRGVSIVTNIAERDAIVSDFRKLGATSNIIGDGLYRYIGADLLDATWQDSTKWIRLSDQETTTEILTINDANVATYVGDGGAGRDFIINIPANTNIISVETTSVQKVYGAQFASTPENGKRVQIIGGYVLEYACISSETSEGRFSQYLYQYLGGVLGGSESKVIDGFTDFTYWNGKMYSKGY